MNKNSLLIFFFLFVINCASGQEMPTGIFVKNIDGQTIVSDSLIELNGFTLIFFWNVTCHHSVDVMTTINDDYLEEWEEKFNLEMLGISIDDSRNLAKVDPIRATNDWSFAILYDENSELRRALNVTSAPHVFLFKEEKIVWQKNILFEGDENEILEQINKHKDQ